MRTIAVIMMGVLRAGFLGAVGFLLGYEYGGNPLAVLLEGVGIALGLVIVIAEEATRDDPHPSPSTRWLRLIGGGGLGVLVGGALVAAIDRNLVSHAVMVVLLAAGVGGLIAILLELAKQFTGGGFFRRLLHALYEGAVGAVGGFSIGLLIVFQAYKPQWISVPAGSSKDAVGTWFGSALTSSFVAWLAFVFIPGIIALLGALVGLIAGAIVAFTSRHRNYHMP
jgi:hypothetical protein